MTCPFKLVPFLGTFVHFQGVVYLKEWMLRAFSSVFFLRSWPKGKRVVDEQLGVLHQPFIVVKHLGLKLPTCMLSRYLSPKWDSTW